MVSSVATSHHAGNGAPYNMGKAALEALAFTLAKEERRHGIHVNVVAPGLVDTDMGERLAKAMTGVTDIRALDATSPFGHVCQPHRRRPGRAVAVQRRARATSPASASSATAAARSSPTEPALTAASRMTTHGVVIPRRKRLGAGRGRAVRGGRGGQGMPRRSQRSRMRPSPSTVSDGRVGREAAPQEQEQVGRRAPHRDVGRDAAVAPADAEDAVVGPERPRLRRSVGRHEPDGTADVDPVAAAEDRRAPDLEQLVDPVGRQPGLDRLGLADGPLRIPAVDGGLLRLPPGPEPPDVRVGGEVPDRCVVVDLRPARRRGARPRRRTSRRSTRAPAAAAPAPCRSGCAPVTTATVAQRCTLPTWPTSRATSQPGQAATGASSGTGVRHRRQRRGLPADRGHVVDGPGGTGVGHGRNVPVVGNLWS